MYKHPGANLCQPVLLCLLLLQQTALADNRKCLFISSYHQGYAWSDGVERGLRAVLKGRCDIRQFDMDSKRRQSPEQIRRAAQQARTIIQQWKPDIVITADDNAVRYLLQPYYKDKDIPFIFSGVNWTADEYGLPYRNATGIIEVAPIRPLLSQVQSLLPSARTAVYIGADTLTELKNFKRFARMAAQHDIEVKDSLVKTAENWLRAYDEAQRADLVIIGSNAGIRQWNKEQILHHIRRNTYKLSVTNHDWMMPYTMLGFTKVAEEQGELAAQAALSILNGIDISRIAIIPNRKWDLWTNRSLLNVAGISLPERLLKKSKQLH